MRHAHWSWRSVTKSAGPDTKRRARHKKRRARRPDTKSARRGPPPHTDTDRKRRGPTRRPPGRDKTAGPRFRLSTESTGGPDARSGGPRRKERRAPTQRARRAPTQRTPGPDIETAEASQKQRPSLQHHRGPPHADTNRRVPT